MKILSSFSCLLILFNSLNVDCYPMYTANYDSAFFMNHVELVDSNQYNLYWNYTDTDITFKVVAKTSGWAGFGLSPNGGMYSSDVVLFWFSPDGSENFVDAHVRPSGLHKPIIDVHQNWKKLYMKQENGFLTVVFTRALSICGQANSNEVNLVITKTQPIIYAYGENFEDELRTFPSYHGNNNRGSKVMTILGSLNEEINLDLNKLDYADFTVDFFLPEGIVTEYYCQMFKIPTRWAEKKRHVVRFDTLTTPENLKYVHHWLMYECESSFETEYLKNKPYPTPGSCLAGNNEWGPVQGHCKRISLAWAVGGDLEVVIPEEYGYPIGGSEDEFKYFFIQLHYENPNLDKNIHDKSGFRIWTTEEYREKEFGILTIGTESSPMALILPPKANSLRVDNVCRNEFIKPMVEEIGDKITIFAELPHTHLTGVEMYSKVLRNNKEVQFISNNPYYDSNYQYVNWLPKPIEIRQGDEITSTCIYSTKDRTDYTLGGLGTYDEMCLNFIWYYPRSPKYAQCLNEFQTDDLLSFFTKLNQDGDFNWVVNNDYTFFEDTVASLMASEKLTNNPEYTEKLFQDLYNNSGRQSNYYTGYGRFSVKSPKTEFEHLSENTEC